MLTRHTPLRGRCRFGTQLFSNAEGLAAAEEYPFRPMTGVHGDLLVQWDWLVWEVNAHLAAVRGSAPQLADMRQQRRNSV